MAFSTSLSLKTTGISNSRARVSRRRARARALLSCRRPAPSGTAARRTPMFAGHEATPAGPGVAKGQVHAKSSMDSKDEALLPLDVVLWDIDNTLADSTNLAFTATNRVLADRGLSEVDMAGYLYGTQFTTPRRLALHATGDTEDPIGIELGAEFDSLYIGLVSRETAGFYPGLEVLLNDLVSGGVRLGALSNACGEYVRAVLSTNGVADMFEVQLGADEVPAAKPAPDGLLKCCKTLGVEPSRCVYVGDAPSDGKAATAAGMRAVGVSWGAHDADQMEGLFDEVTGDTGALRDALRALGVGAAAAEDAIAQVSN